MSETDSTEKQPEQKKRTTVTKQVYNSSCNLNVNKWYCLLCFRIKNTNLYGETRGTNTFKDMCLHKNDIGCNEIVFAFIFSQMFKRLSVLLSI